MLKGGLECWGEIVDEGAAADGTVRVVSWNANFAVRDRMRLQAEYVKKLHPDLLCLQEVNRSSAQELVERAGLDWLVLGVDLRSPKPDDRPGRKRGSAIAGRGTSPVETWLLADLPFPEQLVLAEVSLQDMPWTVASYHAPPGVTWREKKAQQAVSFARWLQGVRGPTVLGGDFNTPEVDALNFGLTRTHLHTGHRWLGGLPGDNLLVGPDKIHELDDALRCWIENDPHRLEEIREARPDGPLAISYLTQRRGGRPPNPWRFDAVWVSKHFIVHDVQYPYEESVSEKKSDHSAVVCDLMLRPE